MNTYNILAPGSSINIGQRQTTFVVGRISVPINDEVTIGGNGKTYKAKALTCKTYTFAYLQNIHFAHSCLPEVNNWPTAWAYFGKHGHAFTQLSELTLIDFIADGEVEAVVPEPPSQETPGELEADEVNGQ